MDVVALDTVIDDKVKQICYGKYMVKQICLVKHICYTNMKHTRNITGVKTPIFNRSVLDKPTKKIGKSRSVAFATVFTL